MTDIKLSSIVATAKNRTIGKDNALLWHIPADFKHFKATTMGKPMIMGRKTFDSLPGLLEGREHIVITRTPEDFKSAEHVHYVGSLDEGIALGREIAARDGVDEAFIIGGGEIYRQSMPLWDRVYLTRVEVEVENGEVFFPELPEKAWRLVSSEPHEPDEKNALHYTFEVYERVNI